MGGLVDVPGISCLEMLKNMPRPRLIKTHLPLQFLPDQFWIVNPKIVYVYRQPKDVAVSYYHHSKLLFHYLGGIKEFVDCFVNDFVLEGPYHEHISAFFELSEIKKNMMVTRFEDMKKDLPFQILRTARFLEVKYTESQISELAEHLSFKSMKSKYLLQSEKLSYFMKFLENPSLNMEILSKNMLSITNRTNDNDDNLQ